MKNRSHSLTWIFFKYVPNSIYNWFHSETSEAQTTALFQELESEGSVWMECSCEVWSLKDFMHSSNYEKTKPGAVNLTFLEFFIPQIKA